MRAGISSENSSSKRSGIVAQRQMGVVADRRLAGLLARAQEGAAVALDRPLHGLDAGALVRAVAERLALRAPAAAPPVRLAGDQLYQDRLVIPLARLATHVVAPPASVASHASPQAFASSRTRRM